MRNVAGVEIRDGVIIDGARLVDVDVIVAEDKRTLMIWLALDDGRDVLWSYVLGRTWAYISHRPKGIGDGRCCDRPRFDLTDNVR